MFNFHIHKSLKNRTECLILGLSHKYSYDSAVMNISHKVPVTVACRIPGCTGASNRGPAQQFSSSHLLFAAFSGERLISSWLMVLQINT